MHILNIVFIKVPRGIFRILFYGCECLCYSLIYKKARLQFSVEQKQYLINGGKDPRDISEDYRNIFGDTEQDKLKEADLIREHIFDLLGSGPKRLSPVGEGYQAIDWHSDFKCGFSWPRAKFFRYIKYGDREGVDIKLPWELSRFQHVIILGQAYCLTKNKKYAEEFSGQIKDWINNNPVGYGINWVCTMDIAIRAANWLIAMEYFIQDNIFSQEFLKEFYTSIYTHAGFISRHMENTGRSKTNHYIADLTGLFFIAVYCPFFKESISWMKVAYDELCLEIENQVYPDGCDGEASTSYHGLVLEMFFYAELLGERAGVKFPDSYKTKVKKMFEFSLSCARPNSTGPQIGDNDSGAFLKFKKRHALGIGHLLSIAAVYYKDSLFKLPGFDFHEEAFWIFGQSGKMTYNDLIDNNEVSYVKTYNDAGWYIMRSGQDHCFISCGYNGMNRRGAHAHNDKLSFELTLDGEDVIVDPGTYTYTSFPAIRNQFRSTAYHNTAFINGCEQNEILDLRKHIFILSEHVNITKAIFTENDDVLTFLGEIHYANLIHGRSICFNKKNSEWRIIDTIKAGHPVEVQLRFHLSPDVYYDNGVIISKRANRRIAFIQTENTIFKKNIYEYSPGYGVMVKAECITAYVENVKDGQDITTYITR